jgi:phosphoglucomutase
VYGHYISVVNRFFEPHYINHAFFKFELNIRFGGFAMNEAFQRWLRHPALDTATRSELERLTDPADIHDRFAGHLAFGTAGLRGIIGAGTNRMNIYTVRRTTVGLGRHLLKTEPKAAERGVVIAYDSRHSSFDFAEAAAGVLAFHGIHAHLFRKLTPTPLLSFAVRHLHASGGIMITASHNPPEYNGYKAYGPDGAQILPDAARSVLEETETVEDEIAIPYIPLKEGMARGLIHWVEEEVEEAYYKHLFSLSLCGPDEKAPLTAVYTPLHGTGTNAVERALTAHGIRLYLVKEQVKPDPDFSTAPSPNPEDPAAFRLALPLAKETGADLILATDPDADRTGVMVKHEGRYVPLTGNQIGALLIEYILERKQAWGKLPERGAILKTIVTSELGRRVAEAYGVETIDLLTGFKYIADRIRKFETEGTHSFLFGYEESYGYLAGDFVRDKDGIQAALLITEMAAYRKKQGQTLVDRLESLFHRFGWHAEELVSFTFKGAEGPVQMKERVNRLRQAPPRTVGSLSVEQVEDYRQGLYGLPPADVVKLRLQGGSWLAVRPSGTEPKLKGYLAAVGATREEAEQRLVEIKHFFLDMMESES